MASFIRTSDHLTIVFDDGVTATAYPSNEQYSNIVQALAEKDFDTVRRLALPAVALKQKFDNFAKSHLPVDIVDGVVYYDGAEMHNTLTRRMLDMLNEGFNIEPMKRFLINLQANPSYRAVNELYGFLEYGNLPITNDGHFLAYKRVRNDFKDMHTGKMDNSVGQIVEMARNLVNEDANQTCSSGLHFCSREYLPNMGSGGNGVTVILKINPADVVAIPVDYNNTKGRACRYEVLSVLGSDETLERSWADVGSVPSPLDNDEDDDDDWNVWEEDADEDDWDDLDSDEASLGHFDSEGNWCDGEEDDILTRVFEDKDGNLSLGLADESIIDPNASGFVGIPSDDAVIIPREVALEIAKSLEEDDINTVKSIHPVLGTEIGRYLDVTEASVVTGTNASSIRKVLNGQRNTAGGLGWERIKKEIPPSKAHVAHGTIFKGKPHGSKNS